MGFHTAVFGFDCRTVFLMHDGDESILGFTI